ncbi:MAG: hypothetical protein ACXWP0_04410 [Ktedonobacterales bacterium]
MALHIIAGVACGGLLAILTPRIHHTIQHKRVQADTLVYGIAAWAFAQDVQTLLERHTRETGQQLIVTVDQWGGTHYDLAAINPRTGEPVKRLAITMLHGYPIDKQQTEPRTPAIAYRAYSGIHRGSFGRPDAYTTRADYSTKPLPTVNTSTTDDNGGNVA